MGHNIKLLCILAVLLTHSWTPVRCSFHHIWDMWKRLHQKQYPTKDVELQRRQIWDQTVAKITEHNLRHDMGLETYTMGLNQFSDLTWDEFKETYLMKPMTIDPALLNSTAATKLDENIKVPAEWDWRKQGRVTPVRDQGACGGCYAFSSAGALEGQMNNVGRQLAVLSVQQIIDCSKDYGNNGCQSGVMVHALEYVRDKGIMLDTDYPFRARALQCQYAKAKAIFKNRGLYQVPFGNEQNMMQTVYDRGPSSVYFDVQSNFQSYRSGIFSSKTCSSNSVNHAMLAVGYGTDQGKKYWLIKNTWSTTWGERGYARVARDSNNMCGIASWTCVPLMS